jgi:uncharacterized membrane protein
MAGIALTFFAIRIIPVYKHSLAGVALLPPMLFSRSTLDADQLTNGLAFLVLALTIRAIATRESLRPRTTGALSLGAFLLAQAKSAYLLLPLQALAIPATRFGSRRAKAIACSIICLPGIAASAVWMLLLKRGYFAEIKYRTWSGIVEPDAQVERVLSDPLAYAGTLLETVFGTAFAPNAVVHFLGVFGPPVMLPVLIIVTLGFLLIATVMTDERASEPQLRSPAVRLLAAGISAATLVLILTLLYVQWTHLGSPVVHGFSGRYLYPLVPLFLLLAPFVGRPLFGVRADFWLLALALLSAAATLWLTWATYLG